MNGDGLMELIVSSTGDVDGTGHIIFYNWTGDDFEEVWRRDNLSGGVLSLAAGLVNEDDLPDLVILSRDGPRSSESRLRVLMTGTVGE